MRFKDFMAQLIAVILFCKMWRDAERKMKKDRKKNGISVYF